VGGSGRSCFAIRSKITSTSHPQRSTFNCSIRSAVVICAPKSPNEEGTAKASGAARWWRTTPL
jgi:hypothetical protein